ncbi:uncharacterized protein LOC119405695 [Rhipicephalus sanguineus]|uniref:uncharacterized protein LOC119405695 n=1 Tax=Rhipicephalus sanguineus TaxID=34632 RepID=UPI001894762C|nr:uncharacterized protein LOC119405695 [Rhipicephalus sanguineus]
MWVTFYLTQWHGEPLIAGYELDGESFVAAPEEMTTPGRTKSIATTAKEPISDVIARGTVKELIDGLRDKDTALAQLDKQIADALDGEEFDEENMGALDYHEKIVKSISRLRSAMNTRAAVGSTVTESNQPWHAGTIDGASSSIGAAHSEAIGQDLADPLDHDHRGFWERYEATIHTQPDLTGIEKFKYLNTYLAGAAKRAIEGISLTEANYNIAVKLFTERFGRKDLLIDDHIDSLLAIEPIETSSQVARLRDLYEQIQFRTSCLESIGLPSSEYAVVLHRVLMRPLPQDLAIQYRKRTKTGTDAADSPV